MQKIIIPLLSAIIVTSCFLSPIPTFAHGGEHDELIIRMTENGFEPKELTVTEGDEVLFINNDDTDRWPASNFHPTHTLYSEFDTMQGIAPGESWKFTFNKVGTWRMHDHLFPHMTGTIIVLEDPTKEISNDTAQIDTETSFFARLKGFFVSLWQKMFSPIGKNDNDSVIDSKLLTEFRNQDERAKYAWLENVAKRDGPEVAWDYIKAAYNTPEGVVGNPHDMAHLVGQLIYKKYGFDGLSICEPLFAFGCYHGLMQVAFDKDKPSEFKDKLLAAENGCVAAIGVDSPSYHSCIHGIGHGITTFRENDLMKSLSDCDLLNEEVRTYCHDGVFMELSVSAPPNFYEKSNPIYPCDAVSQDYKKSCARYQTQVMRFHFDMNTRNIARTCINTNNSDIVYHCIDALGYFIAQSSAGNPAKITLGCEDIDDKDSSAQCKTAAAGELVFQDYVGWHESVAEICDSLSLQDQAACYKRVEQVKQSYGRN